MNRVSKVDKNFDFSAKINKTDVAFYNANEKPFKIYGLIFEDGIFKRIKTASAKNISEGVLRLHKNTAGGRVKFITDSPYVTIHAKMGYVFKSPNYTLLGSAGFDVYAKDSSGNDIYKGPLIPKFEDEKEINAVCELWSDSLKEITINFPHYSDVEELYIGLKKDARVLETKGYINKEPIVFYGSSITQGACSSRPGTTYTNIVSRNLDCDILNLGFSGSALGEEEMANYIANLKMKAFVYDYDFNAPNIEHLENTHKRFFEIIRKKNPDLKILIMSKPRGILQGDNKNRKEIIEKTYLDAIKNGDNNVAFLSGEDLIPKEFNEIFTVDLCHPNDCGFATMAKAVTKKLKEMGI